jgi:hypothetical protein
VGDTETGYVVVPDTEELRNELEDRWKETFRDENQEFFRRLFSPYGNAP